MLHRFLVFSLFASALTFGQSTSGSLSIVSGNGQVVMEQFRTVVPMVVQARDTNGRPIANLPVTWTVKDGQGTISMPDPVTDANGQATAYFIATSLQLGYSFVQTTVNASTAVGNVDFWITTSIGRNPNGGLSAPPLVELVIPSIGNRVVSGHAGSTVPGAILVRVTAQSGTQSGQPIPNVGVRIANNGDPSVTPAATCNAPAGIVLTNARGEATCDVVLNRVTGSATITAIAGEFQNTPEINLQITAGATCTYALNPSSQTAASLASTGTVSVLTSADCGWTAASNAPWLTVTSGASGLGNGTVQYSYAQNTGAARTGTLTIGGQTFTLTQNALQVVLSITTPVNLPSATVSTNYSQAFAASGGRAPYTFAITGSLPPGLSFANGVLSGVPTTAGSYTFTLTATDAAGVSVSQTESLVVVAAGAGPTITTTTLPNGTLNTPYQQVLAVAGGCVSPFSPQPSVTLQTGTLPPGLQLNGLTISGTPTTNGSYPFALKVSDSCGRSSTANLTIVIGSATPVAQLTATPGSLTLTPGGSSSVTIQSTGAALAFQASSSATWLSLDKTSGTTPTVLNVTAAANLPAGTSNATITVTSGGSSVQIPVSAAASANVAISPTAIDLTVPASATAKNIQQSITVASDGAPVSYTLALESPANWLSLSTSGGQTPSTFNVVFNYGGRAVGLYSNAILLTPAGGTVRRIPVSLTITTPPMIAVTPDSLTFSFNQGDPAPIQQTVGVTATGTAGAFLVTSNSTWLSGLRNVAGNQLIVSVNPSGLGTGTYKASLSLISSDPSVATVLLPVTLNVSAPSPTVLGIANAASFARGAVSPGEIVTVFGSTLGPSTLVSSKINASGALDSTLSGTRVYFDGVPAPLIYTVSRQVSAIVPYSVAGRTTTVVQVEWNGMRSTPQEIPVAASAPAIFVLDNDGQGAILNQDYSFNFPATPADAGSIISVYATGEGDVSPTPFDGQIIGDTLPKPKLPVSVSIGGQDAEVLYAGGSPGQASGLFQVNVRIPAGLTGRQPIVLKVGDNKSQSGVFVSIR